MNEQTRTRVLSMWSLKEKVLTQTGEQPLHIYVCATPHSEKFAAYISIYDSEELLMKDRTQTSADIDRNLWTWISNHLLGLINDRHVVMIPCLLDPLVYFFQLTGEGIQSLLTMEKI